MEESEVRKEDDRTQDKCSISLFLMLTHDSSVVHLAGVMRRALVECLRGRKVDGCISCYKNESSPEAGST